MRTFMCRTRMYLIHVSLDIVLAELELAEVRQRGDVPRLVEGSRGGVGEDEEEDEGCGDEHEDGCHILRTTRITHNFTSHVTLHSLHAHFWVLAQ